MSKTATELLALLAIAACLMGTDCFAPEAPPALPAFDPGGAAPGGGSSGGGADDSASGVDGNDGSSSAAENAPVGRGGGEGGTHAGVDGNNLGEYSPGPNPYQGGMF